MKDLEVLGPPIGITDILDYEITQKLEKEAEQRKQGNIKFHPLRPSSAGHCSRKLALELMEYRGKAYYGKPIIEPNIDRLFALGHSVEYAALRSFELVKTFEQRYKQQSLTLFTIDRGPDFPAELIEGSCDAVFMNKKFKGIIDVKSKKDGWSSYFGSKWDEELDKLKNLPSIIPISDTSFYAPDLQSFIDDLNNDWLVDNLLQLNLYACSGFMKERGIQFGSLYRYSKNDSRHMEVRFKPSEEVFNATKEKFTRIARLVDADQVEELVCEFPIGTIRYAFCDCHKIKPYADKDPVKTFFATLPKKVWPKDASELPEADQILAQYELYKEGKKGEAQAKKAEDKIVEILSRLKVSKVRFDKDTVFEVKLLKSPKEHFVFRRSK